MSIPSARYPIASKRMDMLTFARVTRVVQRDTHYFGFASIVGTDHTAGAPVWFCSSSAERELHVGPVYHRTTRDPSRGDILAGVLTSGRKGPTLTRWVGQCNHVHRLAMLMRRGTRLTPWSNKLRWDLHPPQGSAPGNEDAGYVVACIVVFGDVSPLIEGRSSLRIKDSPHDFVAILDEFVGVDPGDPSSPSCALDTLMASGAWVEAGKNT
jgi:hypothetical protein